MYPEVDSDYSAALPIVESGVEGTPLDTITGSRAMFDNTCSLHGRTHPFGTSCPLCVAEKAAQKSEQQLGSIRQSIDRASQERTSQIERHTDQQLEAMYDLQDSIEAANDPEARREREASVCIHNARRCIDIGAIEQATQQIDQALALTPLDPEVWDVRGICASESGNQDLAAECAVKAWRLEQSKHRLIILDERLKPGMSTSYLVSGFKMWPNNIDLLIRIVKGTTVHPAEFDVKVLIPEADQAMRTLHRDVVELVKDRRHDSVIITRLHQELDRRVADSDSQRLRDEEQRQVRAKRYEVRRAAEYIANEKRLLEEQEEEERKRIQERRRTARKGVVVFPLVSIPWVVLAWLVNGIEGPAVEGIFILELMFLLSIPFSHLVAYWIGGIGGGMVWPKSRRVYSDSGFVFMGFLAMMVLLGIIPELPGLSLPGEVFFASPALFAVFGVLRAKA